MRRASSTPALNLSPSTFKKFNEREHAFTEYGQRLKVEKIITGNHPTSQRTTVAPKREVKGDLGINDIWFRILFVCLFSTKCEIFFSTMLLILLLFKIFICSHGRRNALLIISLLKSAMETYVVSGGTFCSLK